MWACEFVGQARHARGGRCRLVARMGGVTLPRRRKRLRRYGNRRGLMVSNRRVDRARLVSALKRQGFHNVRSIEDTQEICLGDDSQ